MLTDNRLHKLEVKSQDGAIPKTYILNDADNDAFNAFAYGTDVKATKENSAAFGDNTQAHTPNQFVVGAYNIINAEGNLLFIVGNGTDNDRSNAFTIDNQGNIIAAGSLNALRARFSNTENSTEDALIVEGNTSTQELNVATKAIIQELEIKNQTLALKQITPPNGVVTIVKTIKGEPINDPIVTKTDLTVQTQPSLTISKKKNSKAVILKGHNLDLNQKYTVRVLMRSRHNGSRTGEWRELTDEEGYGYAQLAGTPRSQSTINFPQIPKWMGSGKLQHTWKNENEGLFYSEIHECHYMEIPYSTWLRPLMKPLIVATTSGDSPATDTINHLPSDLIDFLKAQQEAEPKLPEDEDEESTNKKILSKYTFNDTNPPEIAMLMGLQSSGGYRGLQFKFRIYDANNVLIAETNEILNISGAVHHTNGKKVTVDGKTTIQPCIFQYRKAASIIEINSEQLIENLFITII